MRIDGSSQASTTANELICRLTTLAEQGNKITPAVGLTLLFYELFKEMLHNSVGTENDVCYHFLMEVFMLCLPYIQYIFSSFSNGFSLAGQKIQFLKSVMSFKGCICGGGYSPSCSRSEILRANCIMHRKPKLTATKMMIFDPPTGKQNHTHHPP